MVGVARAIEKASSTSALAATPKCIEKAVSTSALIAPKGKSLIRDKRCVSMPTVTSPSSSAVSPSHSRLVKKHSRRFHRKFTGIDEEEELVNYFACALLSDILLQGYMYITRNYFGFYSNIFGRRTQLLIPISNVIKITKERTAKIIPNAVGVYTEQEKYIFSSLLSRDSTYRLMHQVWVASTDQGLVLPDDTESDNSPVLQNSVEDEDSVSRTSDQYSTSSDNSVFSPKSTPQNIAEIKKSQKSSPPKSEITDTPENSLPSNVIVECHFKSVKNYVTRVEEVIAVIYKLPKTSLLLVMSTALLILLFLSATVLMYRISMIHRKMAVAESWNSDFSRTSVDFNQSPDNTAEVTRLVMGIQDRIVQLSQVRQSLEELLITATKVENTMKNQKRCQSKTSEENHGAQWISVTAT